MSYSFSSQQNISANKSVRFAEDASGTGGDDNDFISKLPRSQQAPSSTRTLFMSNNSSSSSLKPPLPPTSTRSRSGGPTAAQTGSSKDDWLGIQDNKTSLSPSSSPPPTQRRTGPQTPPTSSGSLAEPSKPTQGDSSDEEDALFKDIGLARQSSSPRRRSAMNQSANKPSIPEQQKPPSATPLQKSRHATTFAESNISTPPVSLGDQNTLSTGPSGPLKSNFSSSYLDQLGMSPTGSPKQSLDLNKPTMPKPQPLPSSASLLGTSPFLDSTMAPSFPPKLQIMPNPSSADSMHAFSLAGPPTLPPDANFQQTQSVPQPQAPTKKKIIKSAAATAASSVNTLQLPSHLINEEDLKAMSTSLKTLYANQLELQEKSFTEQMEFMSEANRRREEMLKEEMRTIHSDYEERLDRLKNEIRELETKQLQKTPNQQDITALASLSQQLNSGIVTLRDALQKSKETGSVGNSNIQQVVQQLLQQNLKQNDDKLQGVEGKVCNMVKAVDESVAKRFALMNEAWKNLCTQIKQNVNEVGTNLSSSQTAGADMTKLQDSMDANFHSVTKIVESLEKAINNKEDPYPNLIKRMDESQKLIIGEMFKVQKLQRKVKEGTDNISMEPLVKILESDKDDEHRRKEKLTTQIKEMRRDLKRILLDSESRQESTQKYNMSAEMELKTISQSIRDLNSQLKFSLISGPTHPENLTNQFNSSMQQTQAEMEMKMLREERQALSESMAQINVEKRKLSEEKVQFGKQKLDFEKEKDQLRNLEIQLKTKMEETEDIQRKTETVRREEIHLTSEAQVKLREVEKEKTSLRTKLNDAEQKLRGWEQKLRQEKAELVREREFLDKLRDQLLCPGCMKHNESAGGLHHPPPPPYVHLDIPGSTNTMTISHPSTNLNLADEYFNTESDYLDAYYRRMFN
ncbi:hypothetical protein Ocin01_06951 [Orchesella cincta]|uniref:Fas-binding factor 1 n=1 Tax=Orchesella cincta TaxID=48709 RepID=A0A1D2N3A3_ORCCI|nr:hypothetical protein Ocin01_06951 [Orchesella cincta]